MCHTLGKKTVLFIMADNYSQLSTCHSTENNWIINYSKVIIPENPCPVNLTCDYNSIVSVIEELGIPRMSLLD